jgi:pyruvate dehydrogenase E1 component alpha subunit
VVCCIFGDGAINRGPFLEGLNWAAVFGLPVLFVCEDNGFAATTRAASMTGGAGAAARARAIGIAAEQVDGNDVLAVEDAARALMAAVRGGGGPRFLHACTYRLTGHTGVDAATYRPQDEVAEKHLEEPVLRARDLLLAAGVAEAELDADDAEAAREMAAAYETARAAPFPPPTDAFRDVQDAGAPVPEAV